MREPVLKWRKSSNGNTWTASAGCYLLQVYPAAGSDKTTLRLTIAARGTGTSMGILRTNVTDIVDELVRCEDLFVDHTKNCLGPELWKLVKGARE